MQRSSIQVVKNYFLRVIVIPSVLVLAGCAGAQTAPDSSSSDIQVVTEAPISSIDLQALEAITVDNSAEPVPTIPEGSTVYYLFGGSDDRLLVELNGTQGHLVYYLLPTDFSYGTASMTPGELLVNLQFADDDPAEVLYEATGDWRDLHLIDMVRLVGPTTDIADLAIQDCKDQSVLIPSAPCDLGKYGSESLLEMGRVATWTTPALGATS
ncbi:unannotated protein [freshwater metagenome]|uniref:Unannotated protein n=1 Tax=freshwater metagenome TaxID=449393 RepID=A0A6J5YP19_9ZZZZ